MKILKSFLYFSCIAFILSSCSNPSNNDSSIDVPSGSYHYKSYDADGEKVVEGWFTMEEDSAGEVTGEWHFRLVGDSEDIGTQVGDGVLKGGYMEGSLLISLNPQYKDRNIYLRGILKEGQYSGEWQWVTYSGVSSQGTFTATYKE